MSPPAPTVSAVRAAVAAAVRELRTTCGAPVAFGGPVDKTGDGFVVTELAGVHGRTMAGLHVAQGHGLGGKALAMGRPAMVRDYLAAKGITHAYDKAVAPERLRTVVAMPLLVDNVPRAMVYAAQRGSASWGESFLRHAMPLIASAGRDLTVEEDVRARMRRAGTIATQPELAELHAELDAITSTVDDHVLRERLTALCERFASFLPQGPLPAGDAVVLAPREIEVLTEIGRGGSNAEVAGHLGLRVTTVKSYLQSAMRKLEAGNRVHAVYRARELGLLR